jgi:hypothetical protein
MDVIAVTAAGRGGGATSLTAWLGNRAAAEGAGPVVFLDAGDEPCLLAWARDGAPARAAAGRWDDSCNVDNLILLEREGVDLVMIDCDFSKGDRRLFDILDATNLVVIAVPPEDDRLESVVDVLDIVGSTDKPFVFVINRAGKDEDLIGETAISLAQFGTVSPVVLPEYEAFPLPPAGHAGNGASAAPSITDDMQRLWDYCKGRLEKQAMIEARSRQQAAMQSQAARYDRPATFVVPEMVYPCHVEDITPDGLVFTSDQDIPRGARIRINLPYIGQVDCEVSESDSGKVTASLLIDEARRAELMSNVAHLSGQGRG